ncbi:hypothetical protein OG215_39155 (plasmid) [Streptomyces globisporus]|uniref:hypothetical protein n=1 Tax=Streptomyces globisporus TaxID=1908 RepID=UPI002F90C3C5|nr:hypothetical protein OG215_39155 [Streptomyces globisporus]
MNCEQEMSELAVYAMAALDPQDADRVAAHAVFCRKCAAEVDNLLAVVAGLRLVPAEELVGEDWNALVPRLREQAVTAALAESQEQPGPVLHHPGSGSARGMRAEEATAVPEPVAVPLRAPAGHRRVGSWALAAAVAGVAVGLGGSLLLVSPQEQPAGTLARPAGSDVVRSTEADGVRAAVQPKSLGWGTEVLLELSGVEGGQRCALIAIARDGSEETALTWAVPKGGYGLPGSAKERFLAVGGVGTPADEIVRYSVRTTAGTELVSVPAESGPA